MIYFARPLSFECTAPGIAPRVTHQRRASRTLVPSLALSLHCNVNFPPLSPPPPAVHFRPPFPPTDSFETPRLLQILLPILKMLCSAPAQKSCLNWLDRLRFNKGIPTGDDLDLDSFLANHPNPTSSDSSHSISEPTRPSQIRTRSSEISAADDRPRLSSVLADLLNMGGRLSSGKKCPRKQTNPKFFVASSLSNSNTGIVDCARKDDNVPATNSFNNDTAKLQEEGLDCCDVEEEKENDGNELRGFSKSEVTVIDTSCPGWKVEKFVFRKNNVWKVRERKGKSKSFTKKKNKGTLGCVNHNNAGVKKEPKFMEYQFGSNKEESL